MNRLIASDLGLGEVFLIKCANLDLVLACHIPGQLVWCETSRALAIPKIPSVC